MPDIVRSKRVATQRQAGVHVPGLYAAFIRANCAWREQPDDRFMEHLDDDAYQAAHAEAQARAERNAEAEIALCKPLVGKMIRRQRLLHPYVRGFFSVPDLGWLHDVLCDISPADVVTYNEKVTLRDRAKRAAEAERATVQNRDGHNGTALVEVIS